MSGSTGRTTVGQLLTPAGQLTTLGDLPLNEACLLYTSDAADE